LGAGVGVGVEEAAGWLPQAARARETTTNSIEPSGRAFRITDHPSRKVDLTDTDGRRR
jgi:hypothetical protein